MSTLDLRALLGTLNEYGVKFVVLVASPLAPTATSALLETSTSFPSRLARTWPAWHGRWSVSRRRCRLPTTGRSDAGELTALKRRRNMTLATRHGALDVVQQVSGVPSFGQLDKNAVDSDLLGVPVRVCSLADLRAMKEARGSTQDHADLERLPRRY